MTDSGEQAPLYAPVMRRDEWPQGGVHDTVLVDTAERLLEEALERLRMLTLTTKAESGWHINDVAMVTDARRLSMRGGPRFRPTRVGRSNEVQR